MNFNDLIIFEMANNHQGDVEHGFRIIDEMGAIAKKYGLHVAVKLQYRHLDTFVHPDFKDRSDVKHIPRFLSTRLSDDQFHALVKRTQEQGMLSVVTPFDEVSVQKCVAHGVDVIKVASCSASDWPLIEAIAAAGRPVIASTGGLDLPAIDNLVYFFKHKGNAFGLMHCVAVYPTPNDHLNMDFLTRLRRRYPFVTLGYSGHEAPDALLPGQVAIAKGAQMLERHVGVPTATITLNNYSMNPQQVEAWVRGIMDAKQISGQPGVKVITKEEKDSLLSLQRGVFAKRKIQPGEKISAADVFFAMPPQDGQLLSGDFGRYRAEVVATRAYEPNEAVYETVAVSESLMVREIIHDYLGIIHESGLEIGSECTLELSHHYGLGKLREIGAMIVNFVNREYCKKFVVLLPGQVHPYHFHKQKEETFQVLYGDLHVRLDEVDISMKCGDQVLVKRNTWHSFSSQSGCIFEEISTTHHKGDSFYKDERIAKLDIMQRKTFVEDW